PPCSSHFPYTTLFRSTLREVLGARLFGLLPAHEYRRASLGDVPEDQDGESVEDLVAVLLEVGVGPDPVPEVQNAASGVLEPDVLDRKSTRLNSSHDQI